MRIWGWIGALLLVSGCAFKVEKAPPAEFAPAQGADIDETSPACATAYPSFQRVKRAVLKSKCLECHADQFGTWEEAAKASEDIRKAVFVDRAMPPVERPSLNPQQEALLKAWLDGGSKREAWVKECASAEPEPEPEVEPTEEPSPEPTETPTAQPLPVYAEIHEKFIKPFCLDCHKTGNAKKGLNLGTLEVIRARSKDIFNRTITKKNMPPSKYAHQPSDEDRATFADWIEREMP